VADRKVSVRVDSGASTQITERVAHELDLNMTEKKVGNRVNLANGDKVSSNQ
jgi:predicted aspartyl protease